MKLFILAFILFALSANSAPSPVLDASGKALQAGVKYYPMILAGDDVRWASGLVLSKVGNPAPALNFTCPAGVSQEYRDDQYGDPLTFTPVNPKKGVIRLSTDVNIKFSGSTICHESNVWKLKYDKNVKLYAVMVGGVEGNPGPKTLDNWFKIEKTKDGYKFVFCPSVCSTCKVTCKDLGIVVDANGMSRLAVSKDPLSVNFYT